MNVRSRATWLTALAVLVVLGLLVLFRVPVMTALGTFLVHSEPPRKADIAIVLAGGADGARILRAADLVKDGFTPLVIVSGPGGTYGWHECDLAIPFAMKHGFPENYFAHFEHSAHSTNEEAEAITAELRRRGVKSVLLVTSNFHTHRAWDLFRKHAPEITFIPIEAPDKYFTPDGWWHEREGQKTFLVEWEKTIATWVGL